MGWDVFLGSSERGYEFLVNDYGRDASSEISYWFSGRFALENSSSQLICVHNNGYKFICGVPSPIKRMSVHDPGSLEVLTYLLGLDTRVWRISEEIIVSISNMVMVVTHEEHGDLLQEVLCSFEISSHLRGHTSDNLTDIYQSPYTLYMDIELTEGLKWFRTFEQTLKNLKTEVHIAPFNQCVECGGEISLNEYKSV